MDAVQVRFRCPGKKETLTLSLPRDTRFSALTAMLYREKFIAPQKPGYRYLYQEHMCGMKHTLGDYIPADAHKMELDIFQFPAVLV